MARIRKAAPASAERKDFATRLAELRKAYGREIGEPALEMGKFAQMLGLEPETYRRYERAEVEPPLRVLTAIHNLTGVSLNSLIAGNISKVA
jgi:transcriptional regulator with XRE-family HTH domain